MSVGLSFTVLLRRIILMSPNTSSAKELTNGAEVNRGDNVGWTEFHSAAQENHLDVTKYLISQGAYVNRGDHFGRTALHVAAFNGHLEVTEYLVSQGADVNEIDNDAEVNKSTDKGRTAIQLAAQNGNIDVTKYLIIEGAEQNEEDNDGMTALHHAVQNGYLDVVKVLMAGGAHFDIGDIHDQTPLHLSLVLGYESIADLFTNCSNAKTDLMDIHIAIQHGHISTIEKLVSEGADLNIKSPEGQTCLHEAIKICNNSEKIVKETETLRKISDEWYGGELSPKKALVFYLLENGAKVDVKDERGNLPIQYAKGEVVKQMILSR
ncbi:serine/threonine-protein phosphatase 6 regulatory ankyrin repeat subunit C-like [Strongylocentrotus purpuratus]|uniref:Uncharacterized protein n=1 Tax=Strongylocentrotus purpuratus TaxID=7668 RepID=A0A7M7T031_STRPU|nr:serine/threonine-protein phosphatase 6 regulatory ankyrin repeat subunit C-like [Strongylocentrotus purpuratus]